MSGSKKPAIDGQLIILAAGDKSLFDDATPAFSKMGKRSFYLGATGEGTGDDCSCSVPPTLQPALTCDPPGSCGVCLPCVAGAGARMKLVVKCVMCDAQRPAASPQPSAGDCMPSP